MKTQSQKIKNYLAILLIGLLPAMSMAQGKLGNLKDKAKEKVGGGKEKTTETTTTTTTTEKTKTGTTAVADARGIPVTSTTVIMNKTLGGKTAETEFLSSDRIFVRFAFPKPMAEIFQESMGMTDMPMSGSYVLAIGKNAEDPDPIVIVQSDFSVSGYNKNNTFDFVMQGDEALWDKLARPDAELDAMYYTSSENTMASKGLSVNWVNKALYFKNGSYEYEIFLYFMPWSNKDESKIKFVTSGKFTYKVTDESKKGMIVNLNDYDKQRFEKTPDDGYPTAVHKSNPGKLVFTNSFMGKTFDDATKVKNSYDNLSGGIYSRLYLKESMRNFYADYGMGKDVSGATYSLFFYVDGNSEYSCYQDSKISKEEAMTMTSWAIPLAPVNKEDFDYDNGTVNRFAYVISELTPGKHKIKVVAKSQYGATREESAVIGEGEIEINITAADRDAFVKKYGLQMPEKGLLATDAKLLADVKIVAGKEAIDVRCPNKWEEIKDAWGVVIRRETIVAYSYKDDKGRCKQDTFMIQQPKTTSGWGATNASVSKTWYGLDAYLPIQNSK